MDRKKISVSLVSVSLILSALMFSALAKQTPISVSSSACSECGLGGYVESVVALEDGDPIKLELFKTYREHVGYVTAGIGVRNTGRGTISLSLPQGAAMIAAWLYWMVLDNAENPKPNNDLIDINGIRVTGTLIGSGPDPCWQPDTGFTYRADVRPALLWYTGGAKGGAFGIHIGGMNSYRKDGASAWPPDTQPWQRPLAEYAGIIIIFRHKDLPAESVVQIYDGYYMQPGGNAGFTYNWPARTVGGARFSHLTGDGQQYGITPFAKNVNFNGTMIDFVALNGLDPSITAKATYEGSLADTDTYNVGSLVSTAGGATPITWNCANDCISWAALVFWTATDAP